MVRQKVPGRPPLVLRARRRIGVDPRSILASLVRIDEVLPELGRTIPDRRRRTMRDVLNYFEGAMADRRLQDVFFYSLESTLKSYRRFAQTRLQESGIDITIDQWLVLKTIHESPDVTQQQVGSAVFKDFASVARIVQLLERKGFLHRKPHPNDKRRSELVLTRSGHSLLRTLEPIIHAYRSEALNGVDKEDVERMRRALRRITANCEEGR